GAGSGRGAGAERRGRIAYRHGGRRRDRGQGGVSEGVMTLPAKAGSFSGNGMTCSEGVAVYRWRLKAPSEPWSECEPQDIQRGVQVSTDAQAAGTAMPALTEGLGDLLAAARTGLRCAGG